MAQRRSAIDERQIQGLKYLDALLPRLAELHQVGCQRDKAGNRKLHYDQYVLLVLLFLFNPVLRSLRALQQASMLAKVQKQLGCPRTSLGSLSEATEVFDPARLEGIIGELFAQLPAPATRIGGGQLKQTLTAVDGSVVKTLVSLAEAAYLRDKQGGSHSGWRFHTHFDVERRVPLRIDVTTAHNSGKTDEKQLLRAAWSPIAVMCSTAGMLSLRSSTRLSSAAAAMFADCATIATWRPCVKSEPCLSGRKPPACCATSSST